MLRILLVICLLVHSGILQPRALDGVVLGQTGRDRPETPHGRSVPDSETLAHRMCHDNTTSASGAACASALVNRRPPPGLAPVAPAMPGWRAVAMTAPPPPGPANGEMGCVGPCVLDVDFDAPTWTQDYRQAGSGCGAGWHGVQNGVTDHGHWHPPGICDEILGAADARGTGRGFRHYRLSGSNNNGGGLKLTFSPLSDLSMSYRMRYAQGMRWSGGGPSYTKDWYYIAGRELVIVGFQGGGYGINIGGSINIPGSMTWSRMMGGSASDGEWKCVDVRFNMAADTVEVWVDGTKVLNRRNAGYRNETIDHLATENQSTVATPGYTDYDDIRIDTGLPAGARIGCDSY